MNPEEFDKRLSNCFKDEFLPPDDKLWQNINTRLDQGGKKPFWYWLAPVVIVFVAVGAWLLGGNGMTEKSNNTAEGAKNSSIASNNSNTNNKNNALIETEETEENETTDTDNNSSTTNSETPELPVKAVSGNNNVTIEKSSEKNNNPAVKKKPKTVRSSSSSSSSSSTTSTTNPFVSTTPTTVTPNSTTDDNEYVVPLRGRRIKSLHNFIYFFNADSLITFNNPIKKAALAPTKRSSPYTNNPVDFDKKWWWNFGMGPQIAYNKISVPGDLKDYVHHALWDNKSKLTRNGSGFQSQLFLGYRFTKHFSIESGLQYSLRTEPIKMNVTSYDIPARDNNKKIVGYIQIPLIVIATDPNTGKKDTTYYDAVSNFSLAATNKYHVFTVPLRFNAEWKLANKFRLIGGIGAGLSMISSKKSSHIDIVEGNEVTEKKLRSFSGSMGAHLGFYTNFNDIGEIGIYSSFQMYAAPWQINNKQYAIKMSDMQFGISFRRPLNWGK
ncbi:MAG: hypothetical protein V4613_15015 [Bacteroidota bacterium]